MSSERKKAANRANATRSSGPRTQVGKERSSQNALRHGLTGQQLVIAGEDSDAFDDLVGQLTREWRPKGPTECFLVDRLAALQWRLHRIPRLEAAVMSERQGSNDAPEKSFDAMRMKVIRNVHEADMKNQNAPDDVNKMTPEQRKSTFQLARAFWIREMVDKAKPPDATSLAPAVLADAANGDVLGRLSRYETTLTSNLAKALSMLITLQTARTERENTCRPGE